MSSNTQPKNTLQEIQQKRIQMFSKVYQEKFGKDLPKDKHNKPKEGIALNIYGIKARV